MTKEEVAVEAVTIMVPYEIAHLERTIAKERRKPSSPTRLTKLVADRDRLHALFWMLQDDLVRTKPLEEVVQIVTVVRLAREGEVWAVQGDDLKVP